MSNPSQPHVRQSLVPERLHGGTGELTFQITAESVSPTVIAGYDESGMPIEDTVPNAYWEWWVSTTGHLKRVVMRSAPVFSNDYTAKSYENEKYVDHIQAGQMPAWVCPHTTEFRHIKGGPLIKPQAGVEDCGGTGDANRNCLAFPKVCSHMKAEMEKRQAVAKKKHDEIQEKVSTYRPGEVQKMMEAAGKAFGQEMNKGRKGKADE